MKRILSLILDALILAVPVFCLSDGLPSNMDKVYSYMNKSTGPLEVSTFDLSELSFDELAELSKRCQAEMMTRDEWQEVTVPQGNYRVGVDIPAGKWVVRCADTGRNDYLLARTVITWGAEKPQDGRVPYPRKGDVEIYNPKNKNYSGEVKEYVVELAKGDWVAIHPQYNAAVFTPYTGSTGLGFK